MCEHVAWLGPWKGLPTCGMVCLLNGNFQLPSLLGEASHRILFAKIPAQEDAIPEELPIGIWLAPGEPNTRPDSPLV